MAKLRVDINYGNFLLVSNDVSGTKPRCRAVRNAYNSKNRSVI